MVAECDGASVRDGAGTVGRNHERERGGCSGGRDWAEHPRRLPVRVAVIDAIGKLIPIVVAGSFLPTWTRDTILLLGTGTPPWNSVAFVAGNASCRLAIGLVALFAVDSDRLSRLAANQSQSNPWVLAGAALVFFALALFTLRQSGSAAKADPDSVPGWMRALERFPWYAAFGLGFLFMLMPGIQYVYFLAGMAVIASAGLGPIAEIGLLVLFVGALEVMLLTPLAIYAIHPRTSRALLERLKVWIGRNGQVVGAVVLTVIGIAFAVSAAVQFAQ
jgi:hypothetical protein